MAPRSLASVNECFAYMIRNACVFYCMRLRGPPLLGASHVVTFLLGYFSLFVVAGTPRITLYPAYKLRGVYILLRYDLLLSLQTEVVSVDLCKKKQRHK